MQDLSLHRVEAVFGRIATVIAASLALSGCLLPPIVTIASTSADVISYEASGKTLTDHAYSTIARSDCRMFRVFQGKPICTDQPEATDVADDIDNKDGAPAAVATPAVATADPAPAADGPRNLYVTIGSFRDRANAERSLALFAAYHPAIVPATVNGQPFNRVVAGPLTAAEAAALKGRMVNAAGSVVPPRRYDAGLDVPAG